MNNSIDVDKLQAMKNNKNSQFLHNFILYFLTTVISCSFICYPFWFPSMNSLSSVSVQNTFSFFFTAEFLFVVGNIIVIILIKESKQAAGSNLSPATEIYDKYVARIHGSYMAPAHSNYILANKEVHEDKLENTEGKMLHKHAEKKKDMKIYCGAETDIVIKREKGEKEEENYIPTEELNRRVEAYIARVNRQRLLEAKSLASRRALEVGI